MKEQEKNPLFPHLKISILVILVFGEPSPTIVLPSHHWWKHSFVIVLIVKFFTARLQIHYCILWENGPGSFKCFLWQVGRILNFVSGDTREEGIFLPSCGVLALPVPGSAVCKWLIQHLSHTMLEASPSAQILKLGQLLQASSWQSTAISSTWWTVVPFLYVISFPWHPAKSRWRINSELEVRMAAGSGQLGKKETYMKL